MQSAKLPFRISICGLDELGSRLRRFRPTHIVSITDPSDSIVEFPSSMVVLRLAFHDLNRCDGMVPKMLASKDCDEYPGAANAESILAFGRTIPVDSRVLLHCHAGISRSPAAAYLLASVHLPSQDAMKLVMRLRREATPNRLLMQSGDKLIAANGRRNATAPK